jgi:hypothetical protein
MVIISMEEKSDGMGYVIDSPTYLGEGGGCRERERERERHTHTQK